MSIRLKCPCGQNLQVKDHLAGKTIRCPKCDRPVAVPDSAPEPAPSEERTSRRHLERPRRRHETSSRRMTGAWIAGGVVGLLGLLVAAFLIFRDRPVPDQHAGADTTPVVPPPTQPTPDTKGTTPTQPVPNDPVEEPPTTRPEPKPQVKEPAPQPAGPAKADRPSFVRSRPETGPEFDLAAWVKGAAKVDHEAWDRRHPTPYSGGAGFSWYDDNDDKSAQNFIITWGPLGIRTRMHDRTWGGFAAFRRAWPAGLLDAKGELTIDCFEVVDVIPGSPADGHLRAGDLLVAMDGQRFLTAAALHPDRPPLMHQQTRGLEMDAGERLDAAEGRGRVAFDVIRPADGKAVPRPATPPAPLAREAQVSGEIRQGGTSEVELDAKVSAGDELTAILELTRDHNGSCWADVIRPRLEGPAGTLDLSNVRRQSEATGWGQIRRGRDDHDKEIAYKGKAVPESLWFHAPGHLSWTVPPGYDRFRATVVCTKPAQGYRVRVTARGVVDALPPHLEPLHRVVAFDIPKIGTYGPHAPTTEDNKSATVARMTAAWLAGQQQADGSWSRTSGYTHNGYDTAWAALGLLSQADPAYDGHVRKAADYLAFRCPQDGWAIPTSMGIIFLSEYWLRTRDDRILVALRSQVDRLRGEMVYGDWNAGHGHNPGYRGTGVSTGGSHTALAFAVAGLTPVKGEENLVDRMLARAQELAPDGFVPYGRESWTRKFEPNLEAGCTYSGRHGPYLVASLMHGGPKLFTENCSAMYARGAVGGMDQGHACQSLSTTWGLLAASAVGEDAVKRHWAALSWKLTMLRCHDGGFCQNSYRLEYQGGESLLPAYLRGGAYLVVLNSTKRNLAITGAPKWRAKTLPDLPPVCHQDAVALGYYQRNWGVAAAVLGPKAPQRLRDGLAKLLAMGKGRDTRAELFNFLNAEAAPTAREVLKIDDLPAIQKQYLAEMALGVDIRLSAELERKEDKDVPGRWKVELDVQHPLAGYFAGATPADRAAWRKEPPLPMDGRVEIGGKLAATFPIQADCGEDGWQTIHQEKVVDGPAKGPVSLVARVRYKVSDMTFEYDRPIVAGGEEAGNGEKGRKVLNDRILWVKGRMHGDLGGWNGSFTLPGGQFVSAATQGVSSTVTQGRRTWVAPEEGAVPAGTECEFGFTSGWQFFEARLASIRVTGPLPVVPARRLTVNGAALNRALLEDFERTTAQKVIFPADVQAPLTFVADLPDDAPVRGVDLRLVGDGDKLRMAVEVEVGGKWQIVFQGRPGTRLSTFPATETRRVRVQLTRLDKGVESIDLQGFRVVRQADPPSK